ncbi:dynamin family protein [Colletotrichum asianum]|uniref:Dynamin family protein n=1 Tax=Colletotrichum asianum TaxID=702518 RepID=A0A8H3ZF79_9PEZI|nr:dynamin family protein [Colletotrichum asianum]
MSLGHEDQQLLTKTLQDLYLEGLGQHVNLPMVIVCGDSDAAKHTVIEAMTGIYLPQEWFNHRFSMEFIFSKGELWAPTPIKVSIIPASHRNEDEKAKMTALQDDVEGYHNEWRGLLEFIIGRSIVELVEFPDVTMDDTIRIQVKHRSLPPIILLVIPEWPSHIYDYNLNAVRLMKRFQSPRSIILVAHDNLPLLRKSEINRYLNLILDGGGDRTRAIFVVRYSMKAEEAKQLKGVTLNVCRGYTFKVGWMMLKEYNRNPNSNVQSISGAKLKEILGDIPKIDPWSSPLFDCILPQSELAEILNVTSIINDINSALIHCTFGGRGAHGRPARDYAALEQKRALLEKASQALQRCDPSFSSAASSTIDPIHTPTESEMYSSNTL